MSGSKRELLVATGPFSPFSRLYPSLRIHSVRLLRLLAPTFRSITWFETVQDDSDPPAVAVSVHWRPVRVPVYSPRLLSAAVLTYLRLQVSLARQVLAQREAEVIIFAHGADLCFIPMIAARLHDMRIVVRSDGRPSTVWARWKGADIKGGLLFRTVERLTYKLAAAILFEDTSTAMIEQNRWGRTRIYAVPPYVDLQTFRPGPPVLQRSRCVGFVGELDSPKGVEDFVAAVLLASRPLTAIVIGDGPLREWLVLQLGSHPGLKLEHWKWLPEKEMPGMLSKMRVLVVSSQKEGMPSIVLEAMACGTPVVARPVGGLPTIVVAGVDGLLPAPFSPQTVAHLLDELLDSPRLQELADAGRQKVERFYNYGRVVNLMEGVLAEA